MSPSALGVRTPVTAGAPAAGGTLAVQGGGDNAFAALLADLGVALPSDGGAPPAATDGDGAAADLAGTAPGPSTLQAEPPGLAAAPGTVPGPMAGMALLMAQFPPASSQIAAPVTAPATEPLGAAAVASTAALAADVGAGSTDPGLPAATAMPPAAPVDAAAAGQTAAQPTMTTVQALPDMASLPAGWAAAPVPVSAQDAAASAPVYQAAMASRPGDASFAGDLAAQVTVLVEGGFQHAQLRLNPPELGPIQIQLSVSAQTQTADISFSAMHGLTRDSIEQSLPALREMLQAQGLTLGETGVSGGQSNPGDGRDGALPQAPTASAGNRTAGDGAALDNALPGPSGSTRATRGMLDLYA